MSRVITLNFGISGIESRVWTYLSFEVMALSYQVTYVSTETDFGHKQGAGIRLVMLSVSFLLIFGLLTVKWWPEGREVLENLANSNPWALYRGSLDCLANQIRQGMPVGEAVTAFCRDLVALGLGA